VIGWVITCVKSPEVKRVKKKLKKVGSPQVLVEPKKGKAGRRGRIKGKKRVE